MLHSPQTSHIQPCSKKIFSQEKCTREGVADVLRKPVVYKCDYFRVAGTGCISHEMEMQVTQPSLKVHSRVLTTLPVICTVYCVPFVYCFITLHCFPFNND